jgi:hypothetical protein
MVSRIGTLIFPPVILSGSPLLFESTRPRAAEYAEPATPAQRVRMTSLRCSAGVFTTYLAERVCGSKPLLHQGWWAGGALFMREARRQAVRPGASGESLCARIEHEPNDRS